MAKVTPEPGVYRGIPEHVYHNEWDAVSCHRLLPLLQTPAHCKHWLDNPKERTEAMLKGSAFHAAILEPDHFSSRFGFRPKGLSKAKNSDKSIIQELEDRYGDNLMGEEDYKDVVGMAAAIRKDHRLKAVREVLDALTERELSCVWIDRNTGLLCKARLDGLIAGLSVVDFKSCKDARRGPFMKEILDRGYHIQGAIYMRAVRELDLGVDHYTIPAVEGEAPYQGAVYRLSDEALQVGEADLDMLLQQFAACQKTGMWPGHDAYVQDITLPEWKIKLSQGIAA